MNSGQGDRGEASRALGLVTGIGCFFSIAVAVGVGLGVAGMNLTGGNALPLVAGIFIGIGLGGFGVYRMVMRVFR